MTSTAHHTPAEKSAAPQAGAVERVTTAQPARRWLAVTRIGLSLVFLWAFVDKLFGLGYATPAERAWINGGSPTSGYLGNADTGPFAGVFQSMAGSVFLDWLFMIGLLGIGLALLLGIGMRIAAGAGTAMLMLMYAAAWPLARLTTAGEPTSSTNPIVDDHLIYSVVLIVLALTAAGTTWGLGKQWRSLSFVRRAPWLI